MKIVIINGSPRKGNTLAAIEAFVKGIDVANKGHEVEVVDTYKLSVAPCKGCNACECYKGCIDKDDTNMIVDKLVAADMIVFATPVYWWGITAQLKMVIDKCYCKGAYIKNKQVGLIVVGGAATSDGQYDLIKQQFNCIEQYLDWNIVFFNKFSASKTTDLAANESAMVEMLEVGKNI